MPTKSAANNAASSPPVPGANFRIAGLFVGFVARSMQLQLASARAVRTFRRGNSSSGKLGHSRDL